MKDKKDETQFTNEVRSLPGFYEYFTKKELKYLYEIVTSNDGEEVFAFTSGLVGGHTVAIACTNKRIIFINKGMVFSTAHSEVLIDKVNAISYKEGLIWGEISIEDGAHERVIKRIQRNTAQPFVKAVHRAMDEFKKAHDKESKPMNIADELLRYKELLDKGIINEDEFEKLKAKTIG